MLLGHGENSIYLIDRELRNNYQENITEIVPIIADIQDRKKIFTIMEHYQPEIVYHAAAHKHVPLMEYNPREAVKNNVYGTKMWQKLPKAAKVKTSLWFQLTKQTILRMSWERRNESPK